MPATIRHGLRTPRANTVHHPSCGTDHFTLINQQPSQPHAVASPPRSRAHSI